MDTNDTNQTTDSSEVPNQSNPSLQQGNNHKIVILTILVALFLLAGVGAGGYYLGSKRNDIPQQRELVNEPTPIANPSLIESSPAPTKIFENNAMADWKTFESSPEGISLKYPSTLIACGNRKGETTPRTYISVRNENPCDSMAASENEFWIADESRSLAGGENQLFNYLKDLPVGETKDGMTEGEQMSGVIYKRLPDSVTDEFITKNYELTDTNSKDTGRVVKYSFVELPKSTYYFISQRFTATPSLDYESIFNDILSTVVFTQ